MAIEGLPKAKQAYYTRYNREIDYELIKELHESDEKWSITFMCKHLEICRAAYYKWLNRTPSEKDQEDAYLLSKIMEIAESNNSLFGAETMCYTLKNQYNFTCGHNRVARIMCIHEIKSNYRRKSTYKYQKSVPDQVAENVLNREFNADKPNEKWCTDVTEIKVPTTGEKLFLSPVLDLYDRFPVAFEISERNDTELANLALKKAHLAFPEATPLYHSDRGFQYTRVEFKATLERYNMTQSMSRVAKCIDNGPCEGFQGQFKNILSVLYPNIQSKKEMIDAIHGTLEYYINNYPQKRFGGKTCGQVRAEALSVAVPVSYPIKPARRYILFWEKIERSKLKLQQQKYNQYP